MPRLKGSTERVPWRGLFSIAYLKSTLISLSRKIKSDFSSPWDIFELKNIQDCYKIQCSKEKKFQKFWVDMFQGAITGYMTIMYGLKLMFLPLVTGYVAVN